MLRVCTESQLTYFIFFNVKASLVNFWTLYYTLYTSWTYDILRHTITSLTSLPSHSLLHLPQGSLAKMTLGWMLGSEAPSLLLTVILNLYCFLFSRSSHLNLSGSSAGISATWDHPPVDTRPAPSVCVDVEEWGRQVDGLWVEIRGAEGGIWGEYECFLLGMRRERGYVEKREEEGGY